MSNNTRLAVITCHFDATWYLTKYPDIAQADIDPYEHYKDLGRFEGRWPCELSTLKLEEDLCFLGPDNALNTLKKILDSKATESLEFYHAVWILARWHSSFGNWSEVLRALDCFKLTPLGHELIPHMGPVLLEFTALRETGQLEATKTCLEQALRDHGDKPDLILAMISLQDGSKKALEMLNKLYRDNTLLAVDLYFEGDIRQKVCLDTLGLEKPRSCLRTIHSSLSRIMGLEPRVTVIIPAHNAESTLPTALRGLQQQSWDNLEIIVVDDASTDGTYRVASSYEKQDKRIRVIRNTYNEGAYASRNKALAQTTGQYITTHDSDDWSHPQKIELQIQALQKNPEAMASISHWVRCTPELVFSHWRIETSWIYRNMSSLMFRRDVSRKLGCWDRVKVGADTEYMYRIMHIYGPESVIDVLPGIPLSFGRHEAGSLSQASPTSLLTLFRGLRRDYTEAWKDWHKHASSLYLPLASDDRPFPVPAGQHVPPAEEYLLRYFTPGQLHPLISPDWYRAAYPDVADAMVEPGQHYLVHGGFTGRDPGPGFSSTGYAISYLDGLRYPCNPLLHYLAIGRDKGYETLPFIAGARGYVEGQKNILVVSHSCGPDLFGAERSLLDILYALNGAGYNVYATLPNIMARDYLADILDLVISARVLPYLWWRQGRPDCRETIANFAATIDELSIDLIYANTLVHHEAFIAAREQGIPSICHVREIPGDDTDLCQVLAAGAEAVGDHITGLADHLVANSAAVTTYLDKPETTSVIHNMIDISRFQAVQRSVTGTPVIGMVSSNLPKKGIHDFVAMASLVLEQDPDVVFRLIGPENDFTRELQAGGSLPSNLEFTGYLDTPEAAMGKLDILVNLSLVQESFGRTVLEAMAAGHPVICYDHGALPELVRDGINGFLVPYRDIHALIDKVLYLCNNPELICKLGNEGRWIAGENYSLTAFTRNLDTTIKTTLSRYQSKE